MHAEAADRRQLIMSTPIAGAGTNEGDIGARCRIVGERVSAEVGGLAWIRHDAQQSKGHIG
jgi:hypothetical protein